MNCGNLGRVIVGLCGARVRQRGILVFSAACLAGYRPAVAQRTGNHHSALEVGVAVGEGSSRLPRRPAGLSGRASVGNWGVWDVGVEATVLWPTAHRGYEPVYVNDSPDRSRLSAVALATAQLRWYVTPSVSFSGGLGMAAGSWENRRSAQGARSPVFTPARDLGVTWSRNRWSVRASFVRWSNVFRGNAETLGMLSLRRGIR